MGRMTLRRRLKERQEEDPSQNAHEPSVGRVLSITSGIVSDPTPARPLRAFQLDPGVRAGVVPGWHGFHVGYQVIAGDALSVTLRSRLEGQAQFQHVHYVLPVYGSCTAYGVVVTSDGWVRPVYD